MAQRLEHEINLLVRGKRPYSRIGWEKFADGGQWRLTRHEDWPDVKTAGNVVDMAQRFADREGYVLKASKDDSVVYVQFLSHKDILAALARHAGSVHPVAEHFKIPVDEVTRVIDANRTEQPVMPVPAGNPFQS